MLVSLLAVRTVGVETWGAVRGRHDRWCSSRPRSPTSAAATPWCAASAVSRAWSPSAWRRRGCLARRRCCIVGPVLFVSTGNDRLGWRCSAGWLLALFVVRLHDAAGRVPARLRVRAGGGGVAASRSTIAGGACWPGRTLTPGVLHGRLRGGSRGCALSLYACASACCGRARAGTRRVGGAPALMAVLRAHVQRRAPVARRPVRGGGAAPVRGPGRLPGADQLRAPGPVGGGRPARSDRAGALSPGLGLACVAGARRLGVVGLGLGVSRDRGHLAGHGAPVRARPACRAAR